MKYRKKPVVIEAQQVDFTLACPDGKYDGYYSNIGVYADPLSKTGFSIDTLEGKYEVSNHDWIITGVKGEGYPCKPDIFEMTYEKV